MNKYVEIKNWLEKNSFGDIRINASSDVAEISPITIKTVANDNTLRNFVDGTKECIAKLTEEIRKSPIDVGLIGIGENGHIAFNDPPADFDTKEAYIIVNLDERCKKQQMGEGWFATIDDVPKQAVSMTTYQIMQCQRIISCVPYKVKAEAVENTLKSKKVTNMIPATLLKTHPDFILYVDEDSAAGIVNF